MSEKQMTVDEIANKAITDYYKQNNGQWKESLPKGHTFSHFIEQSLIAYAAQEAAPLVEAVQTHCEGCENSEFLYKALTTYKARQEKR